MGSPYLFFVQVATPEVGAARLPYVLVPACYPARRRGAAARVRRLRAPKGGPPQIRRRVDHTVTNAARFREIVPVGMDPALLWDTFKRRR